MKKAVKILVVILVAVGLIALVRYKFSTSPITPKVTAVAKSGTIVTGFPQELIVADDANVTTSSSYSGQDPSGRPIQIVMVSYTTQVPLSSLKKSYESLFSAYNAHILRTKVAANAVSFAVDFNNQTFAINIQEIGGVRRVTLTGNK